ncbi:hypothetical protein BDA99DRAFT_602493 [Phascolomyces articulosus]|uniref:F-box domain-containing protein n=1 Tax=Phascolomyces articulosus TaxID=60185 RepID=A0AAD5K6M2_9FUNG|nr:hypothetical protein BDA99DRAFT_602493 [Phascolomyces articulosus]
MSVFKHAHKSFFSTVSKLKEYRSSPPEPSGIVISGAAGMKKGKSQQKQQEEAQRMIKESPTSSKGYFVSAQLYQEQDDLNAALSIYLQSLKSVPPGDLDYSLLLKEKQRLIAKLKQRSQGGFYDLLPYDVLYLIFGHLSYKELLHCARVCRRWNDFMMEWPEFWNKIALGMPNINRKTLNSLLRGQTQELRLEGPLDPGLTHDIFWLLCSWEDNHFIQKIYLRNIEMSTADIRTLGNAVRCMASSLKKIEWVNCSVKQVDIIQDIFPSCSPSLTRASFSYNKNINNSVIPTIRSNNNCSDDTCDFRITLHLIPLGKQITSSSTFHFYSTLTYLKVDTHSSSSGDDFEYISRYNPGNQEINGIYKHTAALIKKCPNLVHLFLDSYGTDDPGNIGYCFLQAIKSCPQLQTLVIFENAYMPSTVMSDIDQSEYDVITAASFPLSSKEKITAASYSTTVMSNKKTYKNIYQTITDIRSSSTVISNLRRFVFSHHYSKVDSKDVAEVFKYSHASLELLYLGYDCMSLSVTALAKLASLGCPKLREIRIGTGDYNVVGGGPSNPKISTVLVRLFSVCPALESIELDDTRWSHHYLQLNEPSVVEAIAKHCPRLRHLHFFDYYYTKNGSNELCNAFLNFVSRTGNGATSNNNNNYNGIEKRKNKERHDNNQNYSSSLECLKLDFMGHEVAYILVKNLTSLKYLQLKWWINGTTSRSKSNNENLIQQIKDILTERGGSLVVDPRSNP